MDELSGDEWTWCQKIANLIAENGLIISLDLEVLGVEVLDGFEVEQRVDGAAPLLVVGLVHPTTELGPPLRNSDRSGWREKSPRVSMVPRLIFNGPADFDLPHWWSW